MPMANGCWLGHSSSTTSPATMQLVIRQIGSIKQTSCEHTMVKCINNGSQKWLVTLLHNIFWVYLLTDTDCTKHHTIGRVMEAQKLLKLLHANYT